MKLKRRIHVVGVIGSPRKDGNTEVLVDEILRGAEEAGAVIEKIVLGQYTIGHCLACNGCLKTSRCILKDDMPALMEKMIDSDIWVLGTPIYYWGPTGQFKTFVDRWHCRYHGKIGAVPEYRVILAMPFENPDPKIAQHTVGMMKDTLNYIKADLFRTILAPGMHKVGDVSQHPDVLAAARRSGFDAVNTFDLS